MVRHRACRLSFAERMHTAGGQLFSDLSFPLRRKLADQSLLAIADAAQAFRNMAVLKLHRGRGGERPVAGTVGNEIAEPEHGHVHPLSRGMIL